MVKACSNFERFFKKLIFLAQIDEKEKHQKEKADWEAKIKKLMVIKKWHYQNRDQSDFRQIMRVESKKRLKNSVLSNVRLL